MKRSEALHAVLEYITDSGDDDVWDSPSLKGCGPILDELVKDLEETEADSEKCAL